MKIPYFVIHSVPGVRAIGIAKLLNMVPVNKFFCSLFNQCLLYLHSCSLLLPLFSLTSSYHKIDAMAPPPPPRKMAATQKSHTAIERMKQSDVYVPWCDEFEKMISGMNFKANYSSLMLEHKLNMRKRLKSFNNDDIPDGATLDSLKARRLAIAKEMLGKMGADTNIEAPLFCTWGCQIFIGNDCYINRDVSFYDSATITIGDRVLIGPGCCFCTDTHEVEASDRLASQSGSFAKPIRIGDDCWFGAKVTVLPGITIGRGCTIAAGAVVAKDVGDNCLVGGVPARLIRKLKQANLKMEEY